MLVVTPQPSLEPRDYFAGEGPPSDLAPSLAVHTKPRAEKKLAQFLAREGVGHFLPTVLKRHLYAGNRVRSRWVPLFPGYLFLLGPAGERARLWRSEAIVQLVPVPRPDQLYRDLQNVWTLLTRKPSSVREEEYRPGVPVEVVSGTLKGVVGELVRTRNEGDRLVIRIHLFDRAVTVDIDAACVRRLS